MQTFLPDPSFALSAHYLDRQRLGKQRVETLQLLRALHGETKGWSKHPAAIMWRGYEQALVQYGVAVCAEWIGRGYKDSCLEKIASYARPEAAVVTPTWLGDYAFHQAHRSNLVRKLPGHYRPLFPDVPDDLPYVWPVSERVSDGKND